MLLYKAEHGTSDVPHHYAKDRILGKWVSHLRENYSAGRLSEERIQLMNAVGESLRYAFVQDPKGHQALLTADPFRFHLESPRKEMERNVCQVG